MSRDELMMELGQLRRTMIEDRNVFRVNVQITNSFSCPNKLVCLTTMVIGSLIEGKSLEAENWMLIKSAFNPYEEFRQKVINYDPLSMSLKTHEMITLMLDQNKQLCLEDIGAKTTNLHCLLWRWMHVVLKLKEWHNRYEKVVQKHLFQTRFTSDVSIHCISDEE
ncbi:hypothetical protein NAEGRDRAFT_79372 [Naegleria gruberi]|uniref:Uncharacterized protein n=1 Tax=Naegleria gruberi TaxID=5762 RepID=D2VBY3_NAEGR|nr:uncharacterized protein NAEGRDRAFT_79372 [Naegleria gruberi]EFC45657.1 hypothetical protein NAEGRDRAFT_79372 [Naegleria gruberi]|eukprot:XP_002678401.1 hypothetical protein NAEGRDRAFT_79372 [Naegleria gruberi strain NEG-M]